MYDFGVPGQTPARDLWRVAVLWQWGRAWKFLILNF